MLKEMRGKCAVPAAAIGAVAGLLVTAGCIASLLEAWLPPRHRLLFPAKAALVDRIDQEVGIVFAGSSRVHRQVNPVAVESAMGPETQECLNLGVPGLSIVEQFDLVEGWIGSFSKTPRYVVVEPVLNASIEAANIDTERVLRFHRTDDNSFLLRYLAQSRLKPSRKILYGALHAGSFGYYWFNYGKVSGLLNPIPADEYLIPRLKGYMPLGDGIDPSLAPRSTSILAPDFLGQRLAAWEARDSTEGLSSGDMDVLFRLVAAVRRIGAVPVLFVPPRLEWDVKDGTPILDLSAGPALRRAVASSFSDVPLLDYSDPREFPQFYRAELWYDPTHLGTTGAERFSIRLGADLAKLVAAR